MGTTPGDALSKVHTRLHAAVELGDSAAEVSAELDVVERQAARERQAHSTHRVGNQRIVRISFPVGLAARGLADAS